MNVLPLKQTLTSIGVSQSALARELSLSPAAVSQIINHNLWPKKNVATLKAQIIGFLRLKGVEDEKASAALAADSTEASSNDQAPDASEEDIMLLRKIDLKPATMRAFGLLRNPFDNVRSQDEVFLSRDIREVRESMRSTAKHGGFIAVIGESGAGKSTLRRDMYEWINQEQRQIITIDPYIQGMEENDNKGTALKAVHIANAIIRSVAPYTHIKRDSESRFRQVHEALLESYRAGNRHVLIIEEAHDLPIPTLKHLKRFIELEDGFGNLLSIILVGQSELASKLDERNASVREVVQRCGLVTLQPLDEELEGYLKHRFRLANKELSEVMEESAVDALRIKLTGRGGNRSALYPLAVNNIVAAAMNEAAKLGIPRLNADLIREV